MKKISITGPECTGKSWLSEKLAEHFNTVWVPEYARDYIGKLTRPYQKSDLLEIAKGQLDLENSMMTEANEILFCDTDLYVIKVWSEHKFGQCDPWIIKEIQSHPYDLRLLTYIDIPWEEDPQREHPGMRNYFYDVYYKELERDAVKFEEIRGLNQDRLDMAIEAINKTL